MDGQHADIFVALPPLDCEGWFCEEPVPVEGVQAELRACSPQTAGPGEYVVQQGDCIECIAYEHGFYWETLWQDPQNAALRQRRRSPNILFPGDRVYIRPKVEKRLPCPTDKRHVFSRKGVPSRLEIRVIHDGEICARQPYTLELDRQWISGTTDGEGAIRVPIPPNARSGKLTVGGANRREYQLHVGCMDPADEICGVQGRLNNLGFLDRPPDGVLGPRTRQAILQFQHLHHLPETGEPDDVTRRKLIEIHRS